VRVLDIIDDLTARVYLACVIGPSRAPYGSRTQRLLGVKDATVELASNKTESRAVYVTVSRSDTGNTATVAEVIFTQTDQASTNDFVQAFRPGDSRGFVLKPGDKLSMLVTGVTGPSPNLATFSIGQETY